MKTIAIIFVCLIVNSIDAQTPVWQWLNNVSGAINPKDMATDSQGNVYVTGLFSSDTATFGDIELVNPATFESIFLVKYNPDGDVAWAKVFGGNWINQGWNVAVDNADNVFINGFFRSPSITFGTTVLTDNDFGGDNSMFIAKLNSGGDVLWAKSAQTGSIAARAQSLETDSQGNAVMTGIYFGYISFGSTTYQGVSASPSTFIIKYDASGNILWSRSVRNSTKGQGVAIDAEDNIYIAGSYTSTPPQNVVIGTTTLTGSGIFFAKYNPSGEAVWAKSFTGSSAQAVNDLAADNSGNIIFTGNFAFTPITFGQFTLTSNGDRDAFLVKCNEDGNVLWANSVGGEASDNGNKLAVDSQDNIYLSGVFRSSSVDFGSAVLTAPGGNYKPVFISKYSTTAENLDAFGLATTFGGDATDDFQAIALNPNNNLFIGGITAQNTALGNVTVQNFGLFVGKLNGSSLSVNEHADHNLEVFPNPVKDFVNFEATNLDISSARVYDMFGKCIINETGQSINRINMSALHMGIYILELNSTSGKHIKKIVKQ